MYDATRAPKINPNNLIKSASLLNLQYVSKEKPQSKIMPVSNINDRFISSLFSIRNSSENIITINGL